MINKMYTEILMNRKIKCEVTKGHRVIKGELSLGKILLNFVNEPLYKMYLFYSKPFKKYGHGIHQEGRASYERKIKEAWAAEPLFVHRVVLDDVDFAPAMYELAVACENIPEMLVLNGVVYDKHFCAFIVRYFKSKNRHYDMASDVYYDTYKEVKLGLAEGKVRADFTPSEVTIYETLQWISDHVRDSHSLGMGKEDLSYVINDIWDEDISYNDLIISGLPTPGKALPLPRANGCVYLSDLYV